MEKTKGKLGDYILIKNLKKINISVILSNTISQ